MATVRFPEDVSIAGNLQIDGLLLPGVTRGTLIQNDFQEYGINPALMRIHDAFASPISAAANDDLGISTGGTYGTDAPYVTGGDLKALGATTRYARFLFVLPPEYVAGQSVRIVANAGMVTTVADTSCTLDFEAYKLDLDATVVGSDLVSTAAQSINSTSFAIKNFEVTSAGLSAGNVLDIRIAVACNDAATGTAVIPAIAHLAMSLDIKG